MNKVLIGFNVVLAAAVVYLFVKAPSAKQDNKKTPEVKMNAAFTGEKSKGELRIAVVNIDSLNMQYELFKDEAARLQKITQEIQKEMQQAEQKAMQKMQYYQSKDPNLMTNKEKQDAGYQMQKIEQDFMILKNKKSIYLDSLQTEVNVKGDQALRKFLKDFSADKKIDFILRDGYASPLLYSDSVYDITAVVAKALNEEYKKSKGQ